MSKEQLDETQLYIILADYSDDLNTISMRNGKLPADCAIERILALFKAHTTKLVDEMLFDLDEIDNKPWRVFRKLAVLMPDYADEYKRYEQFYSHGGSKKVDKLIEEFEAELEQE